MTRRTRDRIAANSLGSHPTYTATRQRAAWLRARIEEHAC